LIALTASPVQGKESTRIKIVFVGLDKYKEYEIFKDDIAVGNVSGSAGETIHFIVEGLVPGTTYTLKVIAVVDKTLLSTFKVTTQSQDTPMRTAPSGFGCSWFSPAQPVPIQQGLGDIGMFSAASLGVLGWKRRRKRNDQSE